MGRTKRIWLGLVLIVGGLSFTPAAHANTPIVPSKLTDGADGTCDADCSLREAIIKANADAGADVITLANGTYTLSIAKTTNNEADGDVDITDDLTINGPAVIQQTITSATAGHDRVLELGDNVTVTLNSVDITGGSSDDSGGGIRTNGGSTLTINNSTISGNQTNVGSTDSTGGGIRAFGTLHLVDSTVSGNSSTGSGLGGGGIGGGIIFSGSGNTQTIVNSTISDNTANGQGGGIFVGSGDNVHVLFSTISNNLANGTGGVDPANGTVDLKGSIIASNSTGNCGGNVSSSGYNVVSSSECGFSGPGDVVAVPLLGPLQNNGGRTMTRAIPGTSPAVDRVPASDTDCTGTDQRGSQRPIGNCDSGAFETTDHPDASIYLRNHSAIGVNVFSFDGSNQTVTKHVLRGHAAVFGLAVSNAGLAPDTYSFHGCPSSRGFSVHYYNGDPVAANDITQAVVDGTWMSPLLSPGGGYAIAMKIKVGRRGPRTMTCLVTLTSSAGGEQDVVAGKVVAK